MFTRLLVVANESDIKNVSIGTIIIVLKGPKVGIKSSTGEILWFALLPTEEPNPEEKAAELNPTA